MLITTTQHNTLVKAYETLDAQGIFPQAFALAAISNIDQPTCHIWLHELDGKRPTLRGRHSFAPAAARP